MAPTLLQKLFSKKGSGGGATAAAAQSRAPKEGPAFGWSCSEFDLNEIRLIVYQDCDRRGRQVLFDSKAVHRIEEAGAQKTEDAPITCCPGGGSGSLGSGSSLSSHGSGAALQHARYQYTRPASDVNMLGEMMFGSVAMSYKGSTLKIHYIRSPPQLMISKVFSARMGSFCGSTNNLQDSFESINQDPNTGKLSANQNNVGPCRAGSNLGLLQACSSKLLQGVADGGPLRLTRSASFFAAHSTPVDMPSRGQNEDRDSGIARSASLSSLLITPFPSPSSSTSSSSSYQRRWLRSQTTSLENGIIPRRSIDETFSLAEETCSSNPAIVRRKKIAISIIFSLCEKEEAQRNFQDFFFSHFPLFESHMNRLKSAIEKAMISCRKIAESSLRVQFYVSRLMEALGEFRGTIWNLYSVPRIAEPVWLTMMSSTLEKTQLCQRFLKEFTLLIEQINKNQFFAALLTAVLTYHLAWVPTVMPVDHPPVKAFSEKRTSPSVNTLAKTHPYNPLWAQLGDLYGAIGSPVRLSRTVVLGKQRDLVQRILYVLTYFLRCSELHENQLSWSGAPGDGDAALDGSKITTALERGEVEESEYVVVTVSNEPALLPPILPRTAAVEGRGPGPEGPAGTPESMDARDPGPRPDRDGSRSPSAEACGPGPQEPEPGRAWTRRDVLAGDGVSADTVGCPGCEPPGVGRTAGSKRPTEEPPTSAPERSAARACPDRRPGDPLRAEKVTFRIGSSISPESDLESRAKRMEALLQACGQRPAATRPWAGCRTPGTRAPGGTAPGCCPQDARGAGSDRASHAPVPEDPGARAELGADAVWPRSQRAAAPPGLSTQEAAASRRAPRDSGPRKAGCRVPRDIPRNESSDSALGDSDDDASATLNPGLVAEGAAEVELPLPRSQSTSSLNVRNFGRSLLAGYCPSYMPDLVLHGTSSDEKLKQCLVADLAHTVHHPVLDEPIAEAVCIIADTDKWSVQVATSQRKVMDSMKLGQDVLVSSQVSSLLQSILQLYKLHLPADFCIMHLEDRLQEMYLKSKMLSEYLRGHTRVHVKELGVVLGIESNDLPLLTAIASTHSPYVAQILL